jgi:hypothetical protein
MFHLGVLLLLAIFFQPAPTQAQFATSSSNFLEIGEFFDWSAKELQELELTGEPIDPGFVFPQDLSTIYQDFPHTSSTSSQLLQVSLDNLQISFTGLSPGILRHTTNNLEIRSTVPLGYSLYAIQNKPLHLSTVIPNFNPLSSRQVIAGTTCDAKDCTITRAAVWKNPNTPGFGYTVKGEDALPEFIGDRYRPFPALSIPGQQPALIASRPNYGQLLHNQLITVQYQVGVPPEQEAGNYINAIIYSIVPNF